MTRPEVLFLDTLDERKKRIPVTDPTVREDYDKHLTYYSFAYPAASRPPPEERIDHTMDEVNWGDECTKQITYSSQMSPDRLNRLYEHIVHFDGWFSLAIYVSKKDERRVRFTIRVLRQNKDIKDRVDFHLVVADAIDDLYYPVNLLRNFAWLHVSTPLILSADFDFVVSGTKLCGDMRLANQDPTVFWRKTMYTLACFNLHSDRKFPQTKTHLGDPVSPTLGQKGTDVERWMNATEPYRATYTKAYEPYFVSPTISPMYDEMFRFWGNDKVSHVMEMVAHGFEFIVLPNSMVAHIPHDYHHQDQDSAAFASQRGWVGKTSPSWPIKIKMLGNERFPAYRFMNRMFETSLPSFVNEYHQLMLYKSRNRVQRGMDYWQLKIKVYEQTIPPDQVIEYMRTHNIPMHAIVDGQLPVMTLGVMAAELSAYNLYAQLLGHGHDPVFGCFPGTEETEEVREASKAMQGKCSLKVACEKQNLSVVHLLLETRKTFFAQLEIPVSPVGHIRFRSQQLCKWVMKNIESHAEKSAYLRAKLKLYQRRLEEKKKKKEQEEEERALLEESPEADSSSSYVTVGM